MRRIISVTLTLCAVAFILGCCFPFRGVPRTTLSKAKSEIVLADGDFRVQEAWSKAKELARVDPVWDEHPRVVVIRALVLGPDGRRILGRYIIFNALDAKGHIITIEQILIYVYPHEDYLIPRILTHEFLHAIWQRNGTDWVWRTAHPDSETWVCSLWPCD